MNSVTLKNIGKRFAGQWIFKNISIEIFIGDVVAITGYNGCGKSTLLQIIAGYISQTSGQIEYSLNEQKVSHENIYKSISFASPYIDLIEEFTLKEISGFYFNFKPALKQHDIGTLVEVSRLKFSQNKKLKYFSSGMKQRVKLILALMADAPLLLLDEPLSNLDKEGIEWFDNAFAEFKKNKIVFICSNRLAEETKSCNKFLNVEDYK
ncbi:MAG: ATP-binding cassette domain-containing protein [Bacteroidia bacterium]